VDHTARRYAAGSWLGPLIFTILIDDLRPGLLTHKYVDDTTVTETIEKGTVSEMQHAVDTLLEWSELNHININTKKTKKMVIGLYGKENNTLTITTDAVEQVQTLKLLGVMISHTMP